MMDGFLNEVTPTPPEPPMHSPKKVRCDLNLYRSLLTGEWFAILLRRKGVVRVQVDCTDMFEERFQQEVAGFRADLEGQITDANARADDLALQLSQVIAEREALEVRIDQALVDKQDLERSAAERLAQQEMHWESLMESRIAETREQCYQEIAQEREELLKEFDLAASFSIPDKEE